ncbi:MAG: hypothetical protein HQK58_03355 [Deltaproteobacteria bacterium]|nr:hypothetical protein [Deltaproteobacteria bacterium]
MGRPNQQRQIKFCLAVMVLSLMMISGLLSGLGYSAEVTPSDKLAYLAALKDSEAATQDKISTRLLAVVPGFDRLNYEILHGNGIVWEGNPGSSRVLVGTFLDRQTYVTYYKDNLEKHADQYVLQKSLWVTVTPELKNFFIGKECPPSPKRVIQALGLHPANPYEVVVFMWANPTDLFRPSADPEITDHQAEPAIKIAPDNWTFPIDSSIFTKMDNTILVKEAQWSTTSVPYKKWYINRAQTCYVNGSVIDENNPATWGYPWTRLGYTYDWGNAENHVGLSEFVIRIDPNKNGGEATVKLVQAIDITSPDWNNYFKCQSDPAPELNVSLVGPRATLTWNSIPGSTSYTLFYAPYPSQMPISSTEMGNQTSVYFELWNGAAYYAWVRANNSSGGVYSNIVTIIIP